MAIKLIPLERVCIIAGTRQAFEYLDGVGGTIQALKEAALLRLTQHQTYVTWGTTFQFTVNGTDCQTFTYYVESTFPLLEGSIIEGRTCITMSMHALETNIYSNTPTTLLKQRSAPDFEQSLENGANNDLIKFSFDPLDLKSNWRHSHEIIEQLDSFKCHSVPFQVLEDSFAFEKLGRTDYSDSGHNILVPFSLLDQWNLVSGDYVTFFPASFNHLIR